MLHVLAVYQCKYVPYRVFLGCEINPVKIKAGPLGLDGPDVHEHAVMDCVCASVLVEDTKNSAAGAIESKKSALLAHAWILLMANEMPTS